MDTTIGRRRIKATPQNHQTHHDSQHTTTSTTTNNNNNVSHPVSVTSDNLADLYPYDLSMYATPPIQHIFMDEFEQYAIDRVQMLRIIENCAPKGHAIFSEAWRQCIRDDLTKAGLKYYARLCTGTGGSGEGALQARRIDHISHYILRLTYCRTETLRRWFIARELEWFRLKYAVAQLADSAISGGTPSTTRHPSNGGILRGFLAANNFDFVPIGEEERDTLKPHLIASTAGMSLEKIDSMAFYKLLFTEVGALVRSRKVLVQARYAYVPDTELVVPILLKFRLNLSKALNEYCHQIGEIYDDRIERLVSTLHHIHIGNVYNGDSATQSKSGANVLPALTAENIDHLSAAHFPLCMQHIHHILRTRHHLKHNCRLQYGLFLKAAGMAYEQAVEFFRAEYTRIMDVQKFEKDYVYNIGHQYGRVGSRNNYAAYSCIKIIVGNVGFDEHHGCPFKNWDKALMRNKLTEMGFNQININTIMTLLTNGHYQLACTKYFKAANADREPQAAINHPNQYYEESVRLSR